MTQVAFHRKYRPTTLDRVIGQEKIVTRLRGMLSSGKLPSAIAFFGPPSAGKTTLGRCVAHGLNELPVEKQTDYKEVDAADERGVDAVRDLIRNSRFRPQRNKRIILIDEAQQIVSNQVAAQALLKTLEEPSPDTLWIICSMEPEKFGTTRTGKAILSRCTQFILQEPSESDLLKQAVRIAKGEGMSYAMDEERTVLKALVRGCNREMRTLANLMQALQQYYEGLDKKPKKLGTEHLADLISSVESPDDELAADLMIGLYSKQYAAVQRALLDVSDPYSFVKKCAWIAAFMLNVAVVGKHKKIWWSNANRKVHGATKNLKLNLGTLAAVNATMVRIQGQATSFAVPATDLMSSELYFLMDKLK